MNTALRTTARFCSAYGLAVIRYHDLVYTLDPTNGLEQQPDADERVFFAGARLNGRPIEEKEIDEPPPFRNFCEEVESVHRAESALRFLLASIDPDYSLRLQNDSLDFANGLLQSEKVYALVEEALLRTRPSPDFGWKMERSGKVGELIARVCRKYNL